MRGMTNANGAKNGQSHWCNEDSLDAAHVDPGVNKGILGKIS